MGVNSFIILSLLVQASQTSLGDSVFFVNKPQALNGAAKASEMERKKWVE